MTDPDGADQGHDQAPSPRDSGGSPAAESGLDVVGDVGNSDLTVGQAVTRDAARVLRDRATDWFEPLYADADGDPGNVPWANLAPHPHVVGWLDQPGLDVTGVDAVVVGSGLGDDAMALARRGCRVTAFDLSATAVAWAEERFADDLPDLAGTVSWEVADVLDLPDRLVGAFGLVVEVRTVQSLPGSMRDAAMLGVASLAGPGGYLVASTLLATSDEAARAWEGPPWAQAPAELAAYRAAGLERLSLEHPATDPSHAAMEVRLVFRRPDPLEPGGR